MREIKFRVWDEFRKEMAGPEGCAVTVRNGVIEHVSHRTTCGAFSEEWGSSERPLNQDRYKIMQFTGLHDKNGREIYEGDIVEIPGWELKRWLVDYSDEAAAFYFRHKIEQPYDICPSLRYVGRGEVIGNIYENPELIARKGGEEK